MSFWNELNPEPLRQYRWYINFTDEGLNANQFALKSCDKPSFDINVTEHILLNSVHKYPGILKWKPINVKMASVRSRKGELSLPSVLQNFIMKVGGYQPNNGTQQAAKASGETTEPTNVAKNIDTLNPGITKTFSSLPFGFSLQLIQIDGAGREAEVWTLINPFITNIDYGKLDYASEEIVEVAFTINYDYATVDSKDGLDT
jgi:hypothetical protein